MAPAVFEGLSIHKIAVIETIAISRRRVIGNAERCVVQAMSTEQKNKPSSRRVRT